MNVPDDRLAALIYVHMLNADKLGAAVPETAQRLDLHGVSPQQATCC